MNAVAETLLNVPEADDSDFGVHGGRRGYDDEIKAIAAIVRTLDGIEESARCRVVAYVHARYVGSKFPE